jgi:multiple sugar transport system permease protein
MVPKFASADPNLHSSKAIKKRGSFQNQEAWAAYGFILPALLLLAFFVFYPMVRAFSLSLSNYMLINPKSSFIGFDNYVLLFHDSLFLSSLAHSFYFASVVIFLQTAISLGLALLIRRGIRGVGIFRTIYFLPVVISFAIASTIFHLIYNKDIGLLNVIIKGLGFPSLDFLSDPSISMIGIIILCIWKAMGFFMIVLLAGLNNIPNDYYEAAHVDGASPWQSFFYITLPLLKRTLSFVVIITTMDALKIFVPVYVTTGGGPAGSTMTIVYFIYQTAFQEMNMGYATAAAFIFFAIVFAISIVQLRLFKSDVEY